MGSQRVRLDTSLEKVLERAAVISEPAVLATIVATAGTTYRKPGARMLIESDGLITGLLSGGCLENDLRDHAFRVLEDGTARSIEYDMRGEDDAIFGVGAGCEGLLRILLEPAAATGGVTSSLVKAMKMSHTGEVVALASVHDGRVSPKGTRVWPVDKDASFEGPLADACRRAVFDGTSIAFSWGESLDEKKAWIQVLQPPPRVLLCGAGPDVEPLVDALHALRFLVSVVDHRPAYADARRFPGARVLLGDASDLAKVVDLSAFMAAVVMSHHVASDSAYLSALAQSELGYIGILGPRKRRAKILANLGAAREQLEPRLRGPVGIDIGAVTPEGIALAIAAELTLLRGALTRSHC